MRCCFFSFLFLAFSLLILLQRREEDALLCLQRAVTLNPLSVANTELKLLKRTQMMREKEAAATFIKDQSDRMAEARSRIATSKRAFGIADLEETRAKVQESRHKIREERRQLELQYSAATRVKFVFRKETKAFRLGPELIEELIERFSIEDVEVLIFQQEDVTNVDGFSVVPPETLLSTDNPNFYRKVFITAQ